MAESSISTDIQLTRARTLIKDIATLSPILPQETVKLAVSRDKKTPTLPASKTDPFRKGVSITVAAAPGICSCPVTALKLLFERAPRAAGEIPLFENLDGTVLHRGTFIATIRKALLAAGYDAALYAGHSFRRGAASSAAAAGFSDYEIQLLGRWRSDAYKLYIDADPARIIRLSSLLHWVHPQSAPYEPPVLHGSPLLA
ncbi:hypothetical protein FIBSPDRAFT_1046642 [Athelia psychrophila]|uniref:DNA breaking-rejoining enzyme n=1 Tax=Athelia psychrophila TaxID=1759441 RepID=A0A166GEG5_9AGAM|nr:hypothetical protein FIBSPDRAFT_1046642 [Fibularhizoctonia sp. CBS 109695]